MEIDLTGDIYTTHSPYAEKIVTPIIFSMSYELFRLPSAKDPQDYQLQKGFYLMLNGKVEPEK